MTELVLRFLLGGAIVSLFSVFGEVVQPKSFAGIFGAAPSVALATLGLAFAREGSATVAREAPTFALACIAMLAYCHACVVLTRRTATPVWLAAGGAWLVWLAVAGAIWLAAGRP